MRPPAEKSAGMGSGQMYLWLDLELSGTKWD